MALLSGLWPRMSANEPEFKRDPEDPRWWTSMGTRSEIDINVTIERARKIPVVRDCLKVLADDTAGLQFGMFERVGPQAVEQRPDHPIFRLINAPNPDITSFDLIYTIVDDLESAGEFFAEIRSSSAGSLTLWPIEDPQLVLMDRLPDGTRRIRFTREGQQVTLVQGEFWHVKLPPVREARGTSPILADGLEAVAVAIALQRYANILFTNDATPPYAISMEGNFDSPSSKKNWLQAWRKWTTGQNRHQPGVLEYGMKPHRLGLTAEEAQFLETRKELWLDLCRLWRVPPHKVGILQDATYSNIEHQSLEYVTDTLRPVLELIERAIKKDLIGFEDPAYFSFNVESLLRGDIKTRFEAYALGRQWGWLSVNDILRDEGRNGIGQAGDRYIEPLNMVPVGTDARDQEDRSGVEASIAFLRESTKTGARRPRLELVRDAA